MRGEVGAAELLGLYSGYARGNPNLRLLYDTSLEWRELTGTWPMHHALAGYMDVLQENPDLPRRLVEAFRASVDYARRHVEELIDKFVETFGGDRKELRKRVNPQAIGQRESWSLTHEDRRAIQAVIDLSVEFGFIDQQYMTSDITIPLRNENEVLGSEGIG